MDFLSGWVDLRIHGWVGSHPIDWMAGWWWMDGFFK